MSRLVQQLRDLKDALDAGLLSEAEFEREKQAILVAARGGGAAPEPLVGSTRIETTADADTDPGSDAPLVGHTRVEAPVVGKTRGLTVLGKSVSPGQVDLDALPSGAMFDDRYTIVSRLGVGGMGSVYQAVDSRVGQSIALKVLRPEIAEDARLVEALSREVALAQELNHPNLLAVRHFETRGETPYVVMELMEGGDLDEHLAAVGGRLDAPEALRILRAVLAGLGALHERRIAHLDVKPQNILLGAGGAVKLADFGISSRMRDQRGARLVAGTPEYAPPEQLDGKPCDARADLYAVGMLAHRLLAGRLPFGDSVEAARAWHAQGSRTFPELAASVRDVVAKATAPAPSARWRSAGEFDSALARALASRPWFSVDPGVVRAVSERVHDQVRLAPGVMVSVQDPVGLLERGAARPGWRTVAGAVVLESHPLALVWAGVEVSHGASPDVLYAGRAALRGDVEAMQALTAQTAVDDAALAAAAWQGGSEAGLRQLGQAEAAAASAEDFIAVAVTRRMGLGSADDARASLARAEAAAGDDVQALLDVAAAWWSLFGEHRKAQLVLYNAERRAQDGPGLALLLACAHRALSGPSQEFERALDRVNALGSPEGLALVAMKELKSAGEVWTPDGHWSGAIRAELDHQWEIQSKALNRRGLPGQQPPTPVTMADVLRYQEEVRSFIAEDDARKRREQTRQDAEAIARRHVLERSMRWKLAAGAVPVVVFGLWCMGLGVTGERFDGDVLPFVLLLVVPISLALFGYGLRIGRGVEAEIAKAVSAPPAAAEEPAQEAPPGEYQSTGAKQALALLLGFGVIVATLLCAGALLAS